MLALRRLEEWELPANSFGARATLSAGGTAWPCCLANEVTSNWLTSFRMRNQHITVVCPYLGTNQCVNLVLGDWKANTSRPSMVTDTAAS